MTILLLCEGDEKARGLLRKAISAHYGNHPSAFDSVHLSLSGKVLQSVGPFKLWLSLNLETRFQFPLQFRQDFQLNFFGIPLRKQSEAFDAHSYYLKNRNDSATTVTDALFINSVKQRLWAYSATMLIPLNDTFVELQYIDEHCFIAQNTETGISAKVCLYDNHQLKQVISISPSNIHIFEINMSQSVQTIEGVMVFEQLLVGWNNQSQYNLSVVGFDTSEEFTEEVFQLK